VQEVCQNKKAANVLFAASSSLIVFSNPYITFGFSDLIELARFWWAGRPWL